MNQNKFKQVYVAMPDLTVFKDTFYKCEVIRIESNGEFRLKVKSVHTAKGGLLPDLTARHEDEMIMVSKKQVYESLTEVQLFLSSH